MFFEPHIKYLSVAIIFLGIWLAAKSRKISIPAILLLIVGSFFLVQNFLDSTFTLWSILIFLLMVLIAMNTKFIFRFEKLNSYDFKNQNGKYGEDDSFENFSGDFHGKHVNGIVTGGTLNLKSATLPANGSTVYLDSIIGKYEVWVPKTWKIQVDFETITGRVTDLRPKHEDSAEGPTLRISGKSIIGELIIN